MVLEQLIGSHWIERKPYYAFFFGVLYTAIAIFSSMFIFASDPGYMIVAFITILLIPTLSNLLRIEENQDLKEKKFNVFHLIVDHLDIISVYFFLFMGVFFAVFMLTIFSPESFDLEKVFRPQLAFLKGAFPTEKASVVFGAFNASLFWEFFKNNAIVLFVCFYLSVVYGAGSFLFLSWNAITWGVVIGMQFRHIYMISSLPVILPHLVTETIAYLGAAFAGGILSKALLREKFGTHAFKRIAYDALLFLVLSFALMTIGSVIEAFIVRV